MPEFDVKKRRDKPLMTANSSYNRNRLTRRKKGAQLEYSL